MKTIFEHFFREISTFQPLLILIRLRNYINRIQHQNLTRNIQVSEFLITHISLSKALKRPVTRHSDKPIQCFVLQHFLNLFISFEPSSEGEKHLAWVSTNFVFSQRKTHFTGSNAVTKSHALSFWSNFVQIRFLHEHIAKKLCRIQQRYLEMPIRY